MNKKGYTLIELIAVIIIIGLIATIVIMNFDKSIGKSDNKKIASFKQDMEKAACVFVDLHENETFKNTCYPSRSCNVTAAQLISSGMIIEDTIDPVTNAKVNKNLTINVSWNNEGTKTCTLNR